MMVEETQQRARAHEMLFANGLVSFHASSREILCDLSGTWEADCWFPD